MKKYLSLSVLLLLFAASGCGREAFADVPPSPFDGTPYTSHEKGFSITIPSDWESGEPGFGPAVIFMSPPDGGGDLFRENVNVVMAPLPKPMSTEECFEASMDTMKKVLRGFNLESAGPVKLGDLEAMACSYNLQFGPAPLKMLCYVIVDGAKHYVITCSATEESFEAYKGIFSGIAKSFRIDA